MSRGRRKVAYLSFYTGYALLRPAIVRVAAATCAAALAATIVTLR